MPNVVWISQKLCGAREERGSADEVMHVYAKYEPVLRKVQPATRTCSRGPARSHDHIKDKRLAFVNLTEDCSDGVAVALRTIDLCGNLEHAFSVAERGAEIGKLFNRLLEVTTTN